MATNTFRGLRTTSDFVTNARPENWREQIIMLNPAGNTTITGLTTMMDQSKTDDPKFHWWTKALVRQGGTFTAAAIYSDSLLSSAITSLAVGAVAYVKAAADVVQYFRPGHTIRLVEATYLNDLVGKVTDVLTNGASSYIAFRALTSDSAWTNSKNVSHATVVLVNGNANPEHGEMPQALAYDPTEYNNYTQIFRTALDISRTALQTHLRTGDQYQQLKTDALIYHGVEMEKAFLFGVPLQYTGANGKPERTTGGLKYFIQTYSGNTGDYRYDAAFSGKTWLEGGWDWLDGVMQNVNKYDAGTKLILCGSGVLAAFAQLAKAAGFFNLSDATTSYGLKVKRWTTPFGELDLKMHPLLNLEPTTQYTAFFINPSKLKYRYVQDTMFKPDNTWKEGSPTTLDGKSEEYLTECGLELWSPETFGYYTGVGQNNAV